MNICTHTHIHPSPTHTQIHHVYTKIVYLKCREKMDIYVEYTYT